MTLTYHHLRLTYNHLTLTYDHLTLIYDHLTLTYDPLTLNYDQLTLTYDHLTLTYDQLTLAYNHLKLTYDHLPLTYDHLTLTYDYLTLTYDHLTLTDDHLPIRRTVSMAVDFSKAFDTVNHTTLLTDIHNTNMEHNTIRWLTTYLRGRTAVCRYNNTTSKSNTIHTGVPQGSVISPLLFNLYVSQFPQSPYTLTPSFADDFTVSATAEATSGVTATLAAQAAEMEQWASTRALQVSTQKSTVTLFSTYT